MNIGLFTDTYYPQISGVATSIFTLKERLEASGHNVYIFTTTDPKAKFHKEEHIYRIKSLPFVSQRRIGIHFNRLKKLICKLELDIIHTHTEFSLGWYGRHLAKEYNIPLIHTMHTIYEEYTHYVVPAGMLDSLAKSAVKKLVANFCNSADEVIVPSDKTKRILESHNVTRQISIIPTGINIDKFAPDNYDYEDISRIKAELGICKDDKVLLYIGRISEEKNIGDLFDYVKDYIKENKGIKFLLIGDGPAKKDLEEKAALLGINDYVIFAGQRPWADIGKYYQIGDVFVNASQSETQGLTYIEALAAGLPVIAKADPCLADVITDGINGYTFEEKEGFIKALDGFIYNEQLLKETAVAAEQSVERYSSRYFAASVEKIYQDAIEARLAAGPKALAMND